MAARIAHGACSASGAPRPLAPLEHRCSASTLPAVAPATAEQFYLTCCSVYEPYVTRGGPDPPVVILIVIVKAFFIVIAFFL